MTEIDDGFMEVIASCCDVDGEVDYADDGWKPEDGEYTVLLERFKTDVVDKDGVKVGTGKAYLRVVDGEHEGRSFTEFFWIPMGTGKLTAGHANLLRLGTCISERELPVAETTDAVKIITEAAGNTVLIVRIARTVSKKNNQEYANTRFQAVVAGS